MWCQLQQIKGGILYGRVVICLKSCIFVVSITTSFPQRTLSASCDLLKKLYLCGVNYNPTTAIHFQTIVVICLKSCIFVVSITTKPLCFTPSLCCDLLKKLYLCGVNYNQKSYYCLYPPVVICLKSCIFVVSITTESHVISNSPALWFA